eukprot:UN15361
MLHYKAVELHSTGGREIGVRMDEKSTIGMDVGEDGGSFSAGENNY